MSKKKVIPGSRPNYTYSVLSVSLVLVLLGFFGMVILQANQLIKLIQEQVNVLVEIKSDAASGTAEKIISFLKTRSYTKAGSTEYISKEEGAKMMQKEFGDDFLKLDISNPLYDIVSFNVRAAYMNTDSLQSLRQEIMSREGVRDVYYQEGFTDIVAANLKKIGWIALISGIFFIFVAVLLIHNTIRLALYANRFLIKNMELVGASWSFISFPFIKKSILHGLLSGVIALLILLLIQLWAQNDLPELREIFPLDEMLVLFSAILAGGVLITVLSTLYVVNKYLRMRVEEMY